MIATHDVSAGPAVSRGGIASTARTGLPSSRPVRVLLGLALALLVAYGVLYAETSLRLVRYPFDLDQGEGYDAWSAWLLDRGQLPYTDNEQYPYYSSSYPPFWSYLASVPMAWLGPGLGPARAVSALAGLGVAGVVGFAARRRAESWLAGVLAALGFLGSPYVFHTAPLARVNSTLVLCSVLAVWCFERGISQPRTRRTPFVVGTLALLAALFTKPTALDAAIACLAAAWVCRPRLALAVGASLGAFGLIGLALLQVATRGAFWLDVVQAKYVIPGDVKSFGDYVLNLGLTHGLLLVLAGIEAWRALRRGDRSPWVLFFGASLVLALVSSGKSGAGESYFLGAIAAASVLASACVVRLLRDATLSPKKHGALVGAVLAQALLWMHGLPTVEPPWGPDLGAQGRPLGRAPTLGDLQAGIEVVDLLRQVQGPVLAEDPSVVVAAGKPVVANAAHLRDLYRGGLWDPSGLVADVRARRFDVVILDAEQYPEPVLKAIGESYYLVRTVSVGAATYKIFLPGAL